MTAHARPSGNGVGEPGDRGPADAFDWVLDGLDPSDGAGPEAGSGSAAEPV